MGGGWVTDAQVRAAQDLGLPLSSAPSCRARSPKSGRCPSQAPRGLSWEVAGHHSPEAHLCRDCDGNRREPCRVRLRSTLEAAKLGSEDLD